MKQEGIEDGRLRIMVRAGGCAGYSYDMAFDSLYREDKEHMVLANDEVKERDILFNDFGVTYIADKKTLSLIRGTVVDYVETLQDSGFKFNNPNAEATCGCDKSFA